MTGVVAMLMCGIFRKHKQVDRDGSAAILEWFLMKLVPTDVLEGLCWQRVPDEFTTECAIGAFEGKCSHVHCYHRAIADFACEDGPTRVRELLLRGYTTAACGALQKTMHLVLSHVSTAIDNVLDERWDSDLLRGAQDLMLQGKSKRRRIDQDVRVQVASLAHERKLGWSTASICHSKEICASSTAEIFDIEYMSAYNYACFKLAEDIRTLSFGLDCSRLGSPACDFLLVGFWEAKNDVGGWAAPVVVWWLFKYLRCCAGPINTCHPLGRSSLELRNIYTRCP